MNYQVTLKKDKKSAKFNLTFKKGVALNYSPELGCVEHPTTPNVWIKVTEKEIEVLPNDSIEELKAKHEKIRRVLMDNGCQEYGDVIIDEICEAVGIQPTTVYYKEN